MADNEQKQTAPVAYVPPSQIDPVELTKLFVEDGVISPEKAAEVAGKSTTQEVANPPPAKPAEEEPALLKIAKAKDALRKEKEQVAPHLDMLKAFSPTEAQRLAQARAAGNPVAALAAMGFTHAQYNAAVAGLKDEAPPVEKQTGDPEVMMLKQELAAIKAERENERLQSSRQQFFAKTEELVKDDPKFAHLAALGEYESVERVILQHIQEHGSPPGETIEETIRLAAEVVEHRLKKEAERWNGVLTKLRPGAQVAAKAPESPRPGSESPRTLTNANTTAPAVPRTAPKSREEILAAIARGDDMTGFDP